MLRFAGLGRYGKDVHDRGCELAAAGFTPPVEGMSDGFLRLQVVSGRAASSADVSTGFIDRISAYAAHLQQHARTGAESSPADLLEMMLFNTGEALGAGYADQLRAMLSRLRAFEPGPEVAIDGRLLPHEWILTGSTIVKTDAFDHYQDDFFPGPTDIAWDLAGAFVECGLSLDGEERLVQKYRQLSNDVAIHTRLPFYRVAYLAYRVGYATVARQALNGSADGRRFAVLAGRYTSRLLLALERATAAPNAP
jgi:hypothetical protein